MPRSPESDLARSSTQLLRVLRELVAEARSVEPGQVEITLDSSLDRDLGIDSLARVELTLRLERVFKTRLPEAVAAAAETPRDLLRALAGGAPLDALTEQAALAPALGRTTEVGDREETLIGVFEAHAAAHPERTHITLIVDGGREETITYGALGASSDAVAAGLQRAGLERGQKVALMLPTSREFFDAFLGTMRAGGVPVPIYPPFRMGQIEDHLVRQAGILANAEAVMLVTVAEARPLARLLRAQVGSLRRVVTVPDVFEQGAAPQRPAVAGPDTAFLQYTSGSTGNPKGVVLTHANLLANLRAMRSVAKVDSSDVFVSWLPLYHDMGLIGAWFGSLAFAMHLVVMPPTAFLGRPSRWLETIHRFRGTVSAAPNFAFEICASKLDERDLEGLDLSSLRWLFNGAEPVNADTLERFVERFEKRGLDRRAVAPVYGLAETAVGLCFPPPMRGPRVDRVDRERLARERRALPATAEDAHPLLVVGCGFPIPGHELRVLDESGNELPDRTEGRIEFRGPSATQGYYRNPAATRALRHDEWLDTGDVGYLADGELHLTSRVKDLIKRGGHNVYPYELEAAVGGLPGIRKGCVAVFGVADPASGTEKVVVLAEVRDPKSIDRTALTARVNALATGFIDGPADDVVLAPPHTVPKTSSGKIRRAASREVYLAGIGTTRAKPVWRQLVGLGWRALRARVRSAVRATTEFAWAVYAWALLGVLGAAAALAAIVLPSFAARRGAAAMTARALVRLSGIALRVSGIEKIPAGQAVIAVANHASYVDGILLFALLPGRFVFVAKREFEGTALGWLMARAVGVHFVERFDPRRSADDARRAAALARAGTSLAFFAEGTFRREPGLRAFRSGAFTTAAEAGLPAVSIALRGTRDVLRAGDWMPHRREVLVTIDGPFAADGSDWAAAVRLRKVVRDAILAGCAEPDRPEVAD